MSESRVIGRWSAPGRCNLIGEHTDYTDGLCLPFAIEQATTCTVYRLREQVLHLASAQFPSTFSCPLDALDRPEHFGYDDTNWYSLPFTLMQRLTGEAALPFGVQLSFTSTVPVGAGVSSSAALLGATLLAVLGLQQATMDIRVAVALCRSVEEAATGTRCGTLDFWGSLACLEGQCLLLDLHNNKTAQQEIAGLGDVCFFLAHSQVRRSLAASEYNHRRGTVEHAALRLREISALPDSIAALKPGHLDVLSEFEDDQQLLLRHIITENQRVRDAFDAIQAGDVGGLGNQLNASHRSLRDDFRVSIADLDEIVEHVQGAGAIGARMMGGGFGGCVLILAKREDVQSIKGTLEREYYGQRNLTPWFIDVRPSPGAAQRHSGILTR